MSITWRQAKDTLARYVGRSGTCPDDASVDLFVRKVLQYLLVSGQYGNLRKFCFHAVKGCFAAPYELEVPEKVAIDGIVGTAWSKWFEWHPGNPLYECIEASEALYEQPNYVPTAYPMPAGGGHVGILSLGTEGPDAHAIIQGKTPNGQQVYTWDSQGNRVAGERLTIKKGEIRFTNCIFGSVEAVTKSLTNGYVQLYWLRPDRNLKGFLSEYTPVEEHPQYRQFQLTSCGASEDDVVKVSVLGRIRLKPAYLDNDYIPFENLYTLEVAGQHCNAQYNNDMQTAKAKDETILDMVGRENEYKKVNSGKPIEVYIPTSGGSIKGIVGR